MRRCVGLKLLVLLLGLSWGPVALSQEKVKDVENKAYWLCKNKKDVRTVRVHIDKEGICSTYYSKDGVEKSVGSGKNHDSCVSILQNIKTNLEKSNWVCRDITSTRISAADQE